MPHFEHTTLCSRPVAEVFDFFIQPANLLRVSPPQLHLQLVEAPERLQLGAHITLKGRRWGVPQRITTEVIVFEPNVVFVDEQRSGPFRKWVHTHCFAAVPAGTELRDTIDFEPPGGLFGLVVTESFILKDLQQVFAYRMDRLHEILGQKSGPH